MLLYVSKVLFLFFFGLLLVCGIKEDRFFLCKACRFNFTSVGYVGKSSLTFKIIFLRGAISKQDEKSAAVFIFPEMSAMVKLNSSTRSQAFYKR